MDNVIIVIEKWGADILALSGNAGLNFHKLNSDSTKYVYHSIQVKNGIIDEIYEDGIKMAQVKYDDGILLLVTGPYNRERIMYRYISKKSKSTEYVEKKATPKQERFYKIANVLNRI